MDLLSAVVEDVPEGTELQTLDAALLVFLHDGHTLNGLRRKQHAGIRIHPGWRLIGCRSNFKGDLLFCFSLFFDVLQVLVQIKGLDAPLSHRKHRSLNASSVSPAFNSVTL